MIETFFSCVVLLRNLGIITGLLSVRLEIDKKTG